MLRSHRRRFTSVITAAVFIPAFVSSAALAADPSAETSDSGVLRPCDTRPRTTSGFGFECPEPYALANALCSLDPQFNGAIVDSFSCKPIPGSTLFSYSLTYRCTRPEPCRRGID
jgi:hypothetical protein